MIPTLVYFAADSGRNVWIQATKDLEMARFIDEHSLNRRLAIVRIEEFPTTKQAIARTERIQKMAIPRRRRIIERDNPDWNDVAVVSGYIPRTIQPEQRTSPKPPPFPWMASKRNDEDTPGAASGVNANIPIPILPRRGRDAKPLPPPA